MGHMPSTASAKTHATHAEALKANGGKNPNGIHCAHLNISAVKAGVRAAEAAYDANEYALLDLTEVALADGSELVIFHRKKQ